MSATLENLGVNWSIFDEVEARDIQTMIIANQYEHLAALLKNPTPAQIAEIEKIQAQLRPRAFTFRSNVQKEFEIWQAEHPNDITPQIEQEWAEKMAKERAEALANLAPGLEQTAKVSDQGTVISVSNALEGVKGLAETSIRRLHEAGVHTIEALKIMSVSERRRILGPLVAAKIDYIK